MWNYESRLLRHILSMHVDSEKEPKQEARYPCKICPKEFFVPNRLKRHMQIHTKVHSQKTPNPTCNQCGMNFISPSKLKRHVLSHISGTTRCNPKARAKHPCTVCTQTFHIRADLTRHMPVHVGYMCKLCPEKFYARSSLEKHITVHEGRPKPKELDFKCKHCDKNFTATSLLTTHIHSHQPIKPVTNTKKITLKRTKNIGKFTQVTNPRQPQPKKPYPECNPHGKTSSTHKAKVSVTPHKGPVEANTDGPNTNQASVKYYEVIDEGSEVIQASVKYCEYSSANLEKVTVTEEDYSCLEAGELLNDKIIDFSLKYIQTDLFGAVEQWSHKTHIFSTYFYKKLTTGPLSPRLNAHPIEDDPNLSEAEKRHGRVKRWTKKVNIFEKDFLIVPINEANHWFVIIICQPGQIVRNEKYEDKTMEEDMENKGDEEEKIKKKERKSNIPHTTGRPCILILDSLKGGSKAETCQILRDYLQCEWKSRMVPKGLDHRTFSKKKMPSNQPSVQQQPNLEDCGVYLIQYIHSFFRDPISDYTHPIKSVRQWFTLKEVEEKRGSIAKLIRKLTAEQNRDKQFAFPKLNFLNNVQEELYVEVEEETEIEEENVEEDNVKEKNILEELLEKRVGDNCPKVFTKPPPTESELLFLKLKLKLTRGDRMQQNK